MSESVSTETSSANSIFDRETLRSGKRGNSQPLPKKEKTPEQLRRAARKAADRDYL